MDIPTKLTEKRRLDLGEDIYENLSPEANKINEIIDYLNKIKESLDE